jgi:hypothetical protein
MKKHANYKNWQLWDGEGNSLPFGDKVEKWSTQYKESWEKWNEMDEHQRIEFVRSGKALLSQAESCVLSQSDELRKACIEFVENSYQEEGSLEAFKVLFGSNTEALTDEEWELMTFEEKERAVRLVKITGPQLINAGITPESSIDAEYELSDAANELFDLLSRIKKNVREADENQLNNIREQVREVMAAKSEQTVTDFYKKQYEEANASILRDIAEFGREIGVTADLTAFITHHGRERLYKFNVFNEAPEILNLIKTIPFLAFSETEQLIGIRDLLRDEVNRRKQAKVKKSVLKPLTTADGFLRAVADPINQHMFEALTPGAMRKRNEKEIETTKLEARGMTGLHEYTSVYVVESNKKDIYGVIGYKQDVGEALWEFLQKHGALTLQAHIALFARAYAETDAKPGEFITLRISDFCDDLQFARKKRGGHDPDTKRRVLNILECLTQAQMKIMYTPKQGKAHLFTGEIWQRGIIHETADRHADLFKWEPETFNYAPGQYFAFNEWRDYTRNVALIGEGLLKLNANNDKWAIHGGGYLALLSRMNGYRKQTLSVKLLLEKTGLFEAYGKFRKTSEMEHKLIRALETLEEVGVIQKWDWVKMEDDENISQKLATEKLFNRRIEVQYPKELKRIETRLTDSNALHKEKNKRKKQKSVAV